MDHEPKPLIEDQHYQPIQSLLPVENKKVEPHASTVSSPTNSTHTAPPIQNNDNSTMMTRGSNGISKDNNTVHMRPTPTGNDSVGPAQPIPAINPVQIPPTNGNTTFWSFLLSPISYLFGSSGTPSTNNTVDKDDKNAKASSQEEERKRKQDRMIRNKENDKDAMVIKRRSGNSYTHWISDIMQRFATDASKTVTEAFKEPLELLSRSPVLRTGEVIVMHSIDFESLQLHRIFKYLSLFVFFVQFSKMFLQYLFHRRLPNAITYIPHTSAAITSPPDVNTSKAITMSSASNRSEKNR
jgi:hypothetical protein